MLKYYKKLFLVNLKSSFQETTGPDKSIGAEETQKNELDDLSLDTEIKNKIELIKGVFDRIEDDNIFENDRTGKNAVISRWLGKNPDSLSDEGIIDKQVQELYSSFKQNDAETADIKKGVSSLLDSIRNEVSNTIKEDTWNYSDDDAAIDLNDNKDVIEGLDDKILADFQLEKALADAAEEKAAKEKALADAAEEKAAKEKALADAAEEKAAKEKALADAAEEKAAKEKALADAAEEKAAKEKALADAAEEKAAKEKALADAAEEKAAKDKALADAAEEKAAKEKALADAAEEKAAKEKALESVEIKDEALIEATVEIKNLNKTIKELKTNLLTVDTKSNISDLKTELNVSESDQSKINSTKQMEVVQTEGKTVELNTNISIVDYLNSIEGGDASYSNRKKLAKINGINNYTGKPEENTKLLKILIEADKNEDSSIIDDSIDYITDSYNSIADYIKELFENDGSFTLKNGEKIGVDYNEEENKLEIDTTFDDDVYDYTSSIDIKKLMKGVNLDNPVDVKNKITSISEDLIKEYHAEIAKEKNSKSFLGKSVDTITDAYEDTKQAISEYLVNFPDAGEIDLGEGDTLEVEYDKKNNLLYVDTKFGDGIDDYATTKLKITEKMSKSEIEKTISDANKELKEEYFNNVLKEAFDDIKERSKSTDVVDSTESAKVYLKKRTSNKGKSETFIQIGNTKTSIDIKNSDTITDIKSKIDSAKSAYEKEYGQKTTELEKEVAKLDIKESVNSLEKHVVGNKNYKTIELGVVDKQGDNIDIALRKYPDGSYRVMIDPDGGWNSDSTKIYKANFNNKNVEKSINDLITKYRKEKY